MKTKRIIIVAVLLVLLIPIGVYLYAIQLDYVLSKDVYQTEHYARLDDMPSMLLDTFTAVEDKRFYLHPGIDPIGILRIGVVAIKEGKFTQGASTITQQVARNAFLTQEQTANRKIKEMIIALNLDYHYKKKEILESYLNIAYYGKGAYGILDVAHTYYGKEPKELLPEEIAYLVGLVKGPSLYSEHDELALERRNIVLDIMEEEKIISSDENIHLQKMPIR